MGPAYQETQFFSSAKFDEHKNKILKGWSPGYELMTLTNVSVTFPQIGTPIGIVAQYYEHHNMSYVSQSTNNAA